MSIHLVAVIIKNTNGQSTFVFLFQIKKSWQWNELLHWLCVDWSVYSHQSDFTFLQYHFLFDAFDEKKCESFISISSSVMIRNSIKMFDDQYKIVKTFDSQNLLKAFVEYMFEDIEPTYLTDQEQVIFDSLRIRMDNQKKKADSWSKWWSNSHWWWRPKQAEEEQKQKEETTKQQQKNNQTTSKKQAKNNQVEVEVEEEVKGRSIEVEEESSFNKEDMCNKLHDDVSFDKFWNLYPNKRDKKKAKQKFDRLTLIKKQLAIDWILKLRNSEQRKKWFIPLPTTYLNWERREDEVNDNNSRTKQIQDYQRQARLEEAKKLLDHDNNWDAGNDEITTFDRRTEINSS